MSLIVPIAPKNVELRVHFSHMATADDLLPDIETAIEAADVVIPEALAWSGKLENAFRLVTNRKVRPEQEQEIAFNFGQASPFVLALAQKLYDSSATPLVCFNDLPATTPTAMAYGRAHLALDGFETALATRSWRPSFEEAVARSKQLCLELHRVQLKRANHMLKRFTTTVNRARKHPELQSRTPLKALMLVGIDRIDMAQQFHLAADEEPTFTVRSSAQENIEHCMLTQFREFVSDGTISDIMAAALIARNALLNARWNGHSITNAVRAEVDLEVAAMDIDDIRRLYES